MKALHGISYVLVIIGGLDWGLAGIGGWIGGNWNVINLIFGSVSWLENLIYVLIGIAAIIIIFVRKERSMPAAPAAPGM